MALPEGVGVAELKDQADDRFVRLRAPLGVTSFGINQLILTPGQRNRIHRHTAQEEVYVVLAGTLTLMIEGESHEFASGAVVRIAPSVRRQLVNAGSEPCSLLALGGTVAHEHASRDGEAFLEWSDTEPRAIADVPLPADL